MNGHILLTEKQVKRLGRGRLVTIKRAGGYIYLGLKSHHDKKIRILNKIAKLRDQLKRVNESDVSQGIPKPIIK